MNGRRKLSARKRFPRRGPPTEAMVGARPSQKHTSSTEKEIEMKLLVTSVEIFAALLGGFVVVICVYKLSGGDYNER